MLMEKPHDLAVASEQLHFKSNWHGPSLEEVGETVMQASDTHAWKQSGFFFFSFQGIPEAPTKVPSARRDEQGRVELNVEQRLL